MLMTLDVGRLSADQRTSGTWVLLTSKWVESWSELARVVPHLAP